MTERDREDVRAGVEQMIELDTRLAGGSAILVAGQQPRKGDLVDYPHGVPGGWYVAATGGLLVKGHPDRWSVDVVLSDPRER
jgi:hypothetical protein